MGNATANSTVAAAVPSSSSGRPLPSDSTRKLPPLDCTARRIHSRDLPLSFNLGLLSACSDYAPFLEDFCHYLSDQGLGRPTRPNSISWNRTDPLAQTPSPGDTPTRRSTFDWILAGCIPVFFEDQSARLQYGWHLLQYEFNKFSISIPKEDVVFKGLRIADVLRRIPREKVEKMKEKVI